MGQLPPLPSELYHLAAPVLKATGQGVMLVGSLLHMFHDFGVHETALLCSRTWRIGLREG